MRGGTACAEHPSPKLHLIMKKHLLFSLVLLLLPGFSACSDDDEFTSRLPEIEDIACVNQDGSTALRIGDEVTVTVVQSKKGKLLNKTEYRWTAEPSTVTFSPETQLVAYDNESGNPVTRFTATEAGNIKITFTAEYNISGSASAQGSYSTTLSGGGNASYTLSTLKGKIIATKTVRIAP